MRVAQRVHGQWSKEPVGLEDEIIPDLRARIRIARLKKKKKPLTMEERVARSKAIWMSAGKMGASRGNRT